MSNLSRVKVKCIICKNGKYSLWANKDNFSIVKCEQCGLIYVNPRLTEKSLSSIYGNQYFAKHIQKKLLNLRLKMYDIEIAKIEEYVKKGKILDVGCGEGYMLSKLGKQWQKYGIEINKKSAKFAKKKFNLNITIGTLKQAKFKKNSFDVIVLRGVLEHLPNPLSELKEIFRLLKPNGILSVNTPNIDSPAARIFKENFRLIDPKIHLFYFSPKTISILMAKSGLIILKTDYYYLNTPYASPVRDSLELLSALFQKFLGQKITSLSPPFFGSVMNVYAQKLF